MAPSRHDGLPRRRTMGMTMPERDVGNWMLTEAFAVLERADRMHRQFFHLGSVRARRPVWHPPVDVFETEAEVVILVALPGVEPDGVEILRDGATIVVSGERPMPAPSRDAVIHRLEIPFGRFERQITLSSPDLAPVRQELAGGCLRIVLQKTG